MPTAQYRGLRGSDALVWAGLSGAFFLLSLMKAARGLGLLRGFGDFLRGIFKQRGWYEDRRSLQCGKPHRRGRGHGLGRLGPAVDLARHQALSPRRRLCGPDVVGFGAWAKCQLLAQAVL